MKQCTPQLRWKVVYHWEPSDPEIIGYSPKVRVPRETLQQAWRDIETGEVEWRDVPHVEVKP